MTRPDPGTERIVVAHAVAESWLAQTQVWLYDQVRSLPTRVESHVVCERTENLEQFAVPNVHALHQGGCLAVALDRALRRTGLRRHLGALPATLVRHRVRLLHSHFAWIGWENCRVARRLGIPHVVTFYGVDVNFLPRHGWAGRYPELFALADRFLCEGPHMAECLVRLGCPRGKVAVQRLGVDAAAIDCRPRRRSAGEPLRVLIAASFRQKKGIPYAFEALGRLGDEVPVEVTVVGDAGASAVEQQEKARILAAIERHGLGPRTRMLGFQPFPRLLEEAYRHHVFLSPSVTADNGDTEGGAPASLVLMAATGMPIVATRHCDIPDVVADGETGLLAEEKDVDGLVRHLRGLVAEPERWAGMIEAGRRRVEERFDAAKLGRDLAARYEDLLGPRFLRQADLRDA